MIFQHNYKYRHQTKYVTAMWSGRSSLSSFPLQPQKQQKKRPVMLKQNLSKNGEQHAVRTLFMQMTEGSIAFSPSMQRHGLRTPRSTQGGCTNSKHVPQVRDTQNRPLCLLHTFGILISIDCWRAVRISHWWSRHCEMFLDVASLLTHYLLLHIPAFDSTCRKHWDIRHVIYTPMRGAREAVMKGLCFLQMLLPSWE